MNETNTKLNTILVKLTGITGFDHTPLALEAFAVAETDIKLLIHQTLAEERERVSVRERVGNKWKLAKFMHDRYEKYAFIFGWDTQEKTKVPFEDLPEENKKTMLAVAQDILLSSLNKPLPDK